MLDGIFFLVKMTIYISVHHMSVGNVSGKQNDTKLPVGDDGELVFNDVFFFQKD